VVGKVISATAGVIEDAPHGSRLATTLERAVHQDIQKFEIKREQLMKANVDSQTLDSARKRRLQGQNAHAGFAAVGFRHCQRYEKLG
jgi:hypothetical protein